MEGRPVPENEAATRTPLHSSLVAGFVHYPYHYMAASISHRIITVT